MINEMSLTLFLSVPSASDVSVLKYKFIYILIYHELSSWKITEININ